MYKFFFRFAVTTLTILTANLLTTAISDFMTGYKDRYKPVFFTFVGMAVIVVIFYPLFMRLEQWVKTLSVKIVKSGRSVAGKYLGLTVSFLAGLMILCYFYARMWYGIDLLKALFQGKIGVYI